MLNSSYCSVIKTSRRKRCDCLRNLPEVGSYCERCLEKQPPCRFAGHCWSVGGGFDLQTTRIAVNTREIKSYGTIRYLNSSVGRLSGERLECEFLCGPFHLVFVPKWQSKLTRKSP